MRWGPPSPQGTAQCWLQYQASHVTLGPLPHNGNCSWLTSGLGAGYQGCNCGNVAVKQRLREKAITELKSLACMSLIHTLQLIFHSWRFSCPSSVWGRSVAPHCPQNEVHNPFNGVESALGPDPFQPLHVFPLPSSYFSSPSSHKESCALSFCKLPPFPCPSVLNFLFSV